MAEYIKKSDALGTLEHCATLNRGLVFAFDEMQAIPAADVVEVVRCKDCKWFGRDLGYGKHDCKKYEMPYCLETDFCSHGERRSE